MKENKKFPRGKINKKWKWIAINGEDDNIVLFENKSNIVSAESSFAIDCKFVPKLLSEALLESIDLSVYHGLYEIED